MHRDRDSDGDRRNQAARALLKARDEYRLSGWPGYSQRLPREAASVQWAFDHLTPLHLLAKKVDCPFDDLLNMINAYGAEWTQQLLKQSHLDRLHDDAVEFRRSRDKSKESGSRGGKLNRDAKARRIDRAKRLLLTYHQSPELREEFKTPVGFLEARMNICVKTANTYLKEIESTERK